MNVLWHHALHLFHHWHATHFAQRCGALIQNPDGSITRACP